MHIFTENFERGLARPALPTVRPRALSPLSMSESKQSVKVTCVRNKDTEGPRSLVPVQGHLLHLMRFAV